MMLIEQTPVPDAALPVDSFKAHLRLGTGFDPSTVQDAVVRSFLRAAIAAVEARTGKALITRNFDLTLNFWRDATAQALTVAPVAQITAVTLFGPDGSETLVDAAAYWLERDALRPRLRSKGTALPRVPANGSVVISFDAGFGATWAEIPADLQQAVLMLAAHYYEYRNDTALSGGCMPFGVTSLLERYKTLRLGAVQ